MSVTLHEMILWERYFKAYHRHSFSKCVIVHAIYSKTNICGVVAVLTSLLHAKFYIFETFLKGGP